MSQKPTEKQTQTNQSNPNEESGLDGRSRRLIQTLGAVGALGTAGCFDDGSETVGPGGGTETETPAGDGTETETPAGDGTETETPPGDGGVSSFELSNLSPADATATKGTSIDVSVTVTNTGDADGEQEVVMLINGDEITSKSLTLASGDDQTLTFEDIDTSGLPTGEHTHTVATDTDQVSGTLTLEDPSAVFELSGLTPADTTVTQGDVIDVSATVENVGDGVGEQEIELRIDSDVLESQLISLDSGATQTVSFEGIDMSGLSTGEHTHTVATDDDQISGTLTLEADDPAGVDPAVQWHRDMDVAVNPEEATNWDNYDVTKVLDQGDFMDLKFAPDGRLFYITRGQNNVGTGGGKTSFSVVSLNPDTGEETTLLEKETRNGTSGSSDIDTNSRETGGQSIAFDPNFEENDRIYVLYHPRLDDLDDIGGSPYDQFWDGAVERFGYMLLSRFEFSGGEIDPDSETEILRIPQQYDSCCHHGANLEFGPEGKLYVSVGDNSEIVSPYSSMDDRQSRHPGYDAGRTSSNTADVRGSILRIRPTEEGGNGPDTVNNPNGLYEIPEGNLKEVHEERMGEEYSVDEFRPEIFSMGYRNPYVISVDDHTGSLFTATYGPGYGSWANSPERGPPGISGYRLITEANYAGWPYFQGYYPYRRYDHDTGEVGQPYWIDRPHNDSRNNTGLERLPPYEPDLIWQSQRGQTTLNHYHPPAWADMPRPGEVTWKDLEGSGGNCAGPAYRYSEEYGENALPPFFEGKQFFMTSCAAKPATWYITFYKDGTVDVDQFLPDAPWVGGSPHHMAFDPSGRLFVSNYGDGFYMVEYQGPQPEYQPPPEEDQPDRVEPGADGLSTDPPADATVLWDGEDATLDNWEVPDGSEPDGWVETADYFETPIGGDDVQTTTDLGDVHLHLEWRAPESSNAEQPWANSGVFMMQRYEIQVLNDHNDPTAGSPSGSYYAQQQAMVNAVRPPGEWNEYDIVWRAPRWEDGELIRPAQLTLLFNGVVVLSHLDIDGPQAPGYTQFEYEEHPEELPVQLQSYGGADDPIQYRNVWYRDLPDESTYQEVGSAVTGSHPETLHGTDEYTIDPGGSGTTGAAPGDAEVLIDGGLNGWEKPGGDDPDWTETGDYVELVPGAGDIQTTTDYGDAQFHLEYRIPDDVAGEGPFRGSSGVLMMGKYEVQILDTWENPVEADEWAGAYTHQNGPHHDAVRQPGEWQQLDIVWRAPRFEGREVTEPAQVTAFLNGVAVQTRLVVNGPNDGFGIRNYVSHAEQPLRLRDEGSEVQFRNTWIRPFETDDLVGEAPKEESPFPYALDAGGTETDGNVEIDGLAFDRAPDGDFISVTGGSPGSPASIDDLPAPDELEFEGTDHDLLYASEITGEAFSVVADVPEGTYDVTLHFSEWPYFDDDQVPRLQNVSIEDELVLERFECLRGQAQVETFDGVEVTDGELNIDIEIHPDSVDPYAKLNGLEIDKVEEVSVPYGLDAGGTKTDGDVEIDGVTFDASPDDNQFVSATGQAVAPTDPAPSELEYSGTDNDLLYASEMSAPQFSIDIGIEDGFYEVTLYFSDWPYFELGENDRIQDVYIEDDLVLEEFLCEPGVAQPKTFEVQVTDGELNIDLAVRSDSLDPNAKINGVLIREATDDDSGSGGGDSPEADIELAAQSNSAWTGVTPAEVEGVENPTLTLTAGEEYTIAWTNENGGSHNFVIETADGSKPVETELMSEQGQTQSVTFTATEGMTTYYCDPHQTLGMGGSIDTV